MVTIIMPAFNCEKYLRDAVESVKAQTYKDWTLFIIDDCSTDRTRALAKELAETDKRIKVFHNKKNSGVARTRNAGVKKADSEWIAFLDSDDMWTQDKLEKQMMLSEENPQAKLIFTGSGFIKENGEKIDYVLHVPERINRKELLKQNLISCSSVLVKRDLILKYPMPGNGYMHEDFASWLRILNEEPYAYGIDEPLLVYRLSKDSKSGNKFNAALMNWNTYQYVGLDPAESVYYMGWYTLKGLQKYGRLKNTKAVENDEGNLDGKMLNAVIIIPTHSQYLDICVNFLQLLNKYWETCPYQIIISTFGQEPNFSYPNVHLIYNKEATSLIDCIKGAVDCYPSDYYFSFLGDAFINGNVNQKFIEYVLRRMQSGKIQYCNLTYVMNYRKIKPYGNYLRFINTDDRYSHSFVAFIASAHYIKSKLLKFQDDLSFEKYYLSFNGKNRYFRTHIALNKNYLHIVPGINKGKWDRVAYKKLKEKNPEIEFAKRDFCSWGDSVTYQMHDKLIGYIPPEVRLYVKNIYSKLTGKKFVTND